MSVIFGILLMVLIVGGAILLKIKRHREERENLKQLYELVRHDDDLKDLFHKHFKTFQTSDKINSLPGPKLNQVEQRSSKS